MNPLEVSVSGENGPQRGPLVSGSVSPCSENPVAPYGRGVKVRTVLVVLALGVTGRGFGSNQSPLPSATTVSSDALAEYQQSLYDAGIGGEVIPENVKRAAQVTNPGTVPSNPVTDQNPVASCAFEGVPCNDTEKDPGSNLPWILAAGGVLGLLLFFAWKRSKKCVHCDTKVKVVEGVVVDSEGDTACADSSVGVHEIKSRDTDN